MLGLQPFGLPLPALATPPIFVSKRAEASLCPPLPAFLGLCPQTPLGHFLKMPQTPKRFSIPPETRKVGGYASCPSFRRSVSTDYRLLTRSVKRVVLADKDCVFVSNFLFVGCLKKKMRTDKPSSLHSFITGTQCCGVCVAFVASLRNVLLLSVALPSADHRQQGVLGRFAPRLRRGRKTTTSTFKKSAGAHPNKILLHCTPFLYA